MALLSAVKRLDGRTDCDQPSEASTASACNTQTQAQPQSIHTTKWETGFGSFPAKSRFLPRSPPLHPGRLGTLDSLSYTSYSLTFTALASIKRLAISSKTAQLEYRARLRVSATLGHYTLSQGLSYDTSEPPTATLHVCIRYVFFFVSQRRNSPKGQLQAQPKSGVFSTLTDVPSRHCAERKCGERVLFFPQSSLCETCFPASLPRIDTGVIPRCSPRQRSSKPYRAMLRVIRDVPAGHNRALGEQLAI